MKYDVWWSPRAENGLTEAWLDADNPDEVTAAAHRLDRALARDPLSLGESREPPIRIAFDAPLSILFAVNEANRKVVVLDVVQFD